MKNELLHNKLKAEYGDILEGCRRVAALVTNYRQQRVSGKHSITPETIRRACYSQKISARLAMDLIAVLGFELEDLRQLKPEIF
ncbi:MAG: hypothetical protein AAB922_04770 [Patescibacteria group bacterium]